MTHSTVTGHVWPVGHGASIEGPTEEARDDSPPEGGPPIG